MTAPTLDHVVLGTWRALAACRDADPELFHPLSTLDVQRTTKAKQVCADCPVSTDCLAEAMTDRKLTGIWGGTTEDERWNAREKCGTLTGVTRHKRAGEPLCDKCREADAARSARFRELRRQQLQGTAS